MIERATWPGQRVSTHSRPKAAAPMRKSKTHTLHRFNTQPPEGGCSCQPQGLFWRCGRFNTQPPEGGCSLLENSLKIRQLEATFR